MWWIKNDEFESSIFTLVINISVFTLVINISVFTLVINISVSTLLINISVFTLVMNTYTPHSDLENAFCNALTNEENHDLENFKYVINNKIMNLNARLMKF